MLARDGQLAKLDATRRVQSFASLRPSSLSRPLSDPQLRWRKTSRSQKNEFSSHTIMEKVPPCAESESFSSLLHDMKSG
jgi:hypothetical protein